MTMFGYCEGDVTNLQGARLFERSQYIQPNDPFPRIQMSVLGANHNWFNSVWFADGDDATGTDVACGTSQPNNIRLSGGTYDLTTRGSGDPALMGDQEKIGLAMMSAFFRRYVGGDVAFDPYMTGEISADGTTPVLPASACPTSVSGARIPCFDRVMTSYFAAPAERRDVLRPETDNPLEVSARRHLDHRIRVLEPVSGDRRRQPRFRRRRRAALTGATRSRRSSRRRSSASPVSQPRPRAARFPPPARSAARAARVRTPRSTTPTGCSSRWPGTSLPPSARAFPPPRAT